MEKDDKNSMSDQAQHIYQILSKAVETDQIKLPTLPEVALKIREAVEKDSHSAAEIAELLAQDTALSARLLQLANSPLYRSRSQIDNLQMAITRLGVRIVKDLVVMLAIKQAFKANNQQVDKQFRQIWQTSIDVAAACRLLSKPHNELNAEQAVLAGLIHNIGRLPIIELADRQPELFSDMNQLDEISQEIQGPMGEKILSFWNFPQSLIDVASQCNNFQHVNTEAPEYVDIVQAAILHTPHALTQAPDDWSEIPAIVKLGIDPSSHHFDESMQIQLNETRESLMSI